MDETTDRNDFIREVIREDLAAGRLVRPLEGAMPVPFGYYLVHAQDAERVPRVKAFVEWVREEAAGRAG